VLDRESTFAQPEIVKLLKTSFVPVAIDQAYQRRQQDTEGEFYRKVAGQGPRSNFNGTTQGFYIATASGKLLLYNNNRDPEKVLRLMKQKLADFKASAESRTDVKAIKTAKIDPRWQTKPPKGGLVVRVRAKVLDGYEPTTDRWRRIFQTAISRDNLWISKAEHQALVKGTILASLQTRIAKYHLVDNTRGEPPMWNDKEVRNIDLALRDGKVSGVAHLQTANKSRGYEAQIRGEIETKNGMVTRLDLVAKGDFWGEGTYTKNAPKGRFSLAISFTLADGTDVADQVPPQASRGWVRGYVR
jgi:hypothetical protein